MNKKLQKMTEKQAKEKEFSKKLTQKQQKFCKAYALSENSTQASISAGYSEAGASVTGCRLLKIPKIMEYIEFLTEDMRLQLERKFKVNRDRILKERARLAFIQADSFYNDDGTLKDPKEWGPDLAAVVKKVKTREIFVGAGKNRKCIGRVNEIDLYNKTDSLQALERIEGMYLEDNRQRNPYSDLSDEELARRVKKAEERLGKANH